MKAVVIKEPGNISLQNVDIPQPGPDFVRIKVKAAAICATDLEVLDGNIPANYPLTPGHEWSGIVEAVGSTEDAHWIGKPVIGSSDVVCLKCEACRSGNWRYCESFEEIGFKRNGAYAEYMLAPVYGLHEKPDNVTFAHAALCEPLGVALGTLKKAHAKAGQNLLIIGAGSIGLCMLAAAKYMGLRNIVVCARSRAALSIAMDMGAGAVIATKEQDLEKEMATLHPEGTDLIIDATGAEECIQKSLRILKKGGTLALAGYGKGKTMQIRMDDIHIKNLKVVGAGNNWNMHKTAITLMQEGLVDLNCFITETIPLEDYQKGLDLAKARPAGFVKAVFVHE